MDELLDLELGKYFDVREIATSAVEFTPRALAAVLVLVVFWLLFKITRKPFKMTFSRVGMHEALVRLLVDNIYRYTLIVVGIVMGAAQLGINVGAALAGLGVAGIAVGFAARDSLANVIAGIMIFWDKPFIVGEWITVESWFGKVSDITLRTTRIRTPNNTYVVIPNQKIIDAFLENHSKEGELRVEVPVGIAYKEDIDAARRSILEAVGELDWLRQTPEPSVVVTELGDSSINLSVRAWIDEPTDLRRTTFSLVEVSKKALDAAGIQIPFPHLQLFVDDVEPVVWDGIRSVAREVGSKDHRTGARG
jgi:small conductance mechanosensitive channel